MKPLRWLNAAWGDNISLLQLPAGCWQSGIVSFLYKQGLPSSSCLYSPVIFTQTVRLPPEQFFIFSENPIKGVNHEAFKLFRDPIPNLW